MGGGGVFLAFYFKKLGKKKENPVAFPWNALRCCTVCGWGPGTASVPTTWWGGGGCDPAPILHCCPSVSRAQSWMGRGGCFSPTPLIADCSLLFSSCTVRNEGLLCFQLQWHKGVLSPPPTLQCTQSSGAHQHLSGAVCVMLIPIPLPASFSHPAQPFQPNCHEGGGGKYRDIPPHPHSAFPPSPK